MNGYVAKLADTFRVLRDDAGDPYIPLWGDCPSHGPYNRVCDYDEKTLLIWVSTARTGQTFSTLAKLLPGVRLSQEGQEELTVLFAPKSVEDARRALKLRRIHGRTLTEYSPEELARRQKNGRELAKRFPLKTRKKGSGAK